MTSVGVHDGGAVRVFISYTKEDESHARAVRMLWELLRGNGIDAKIDLPVQERRQDWPIWMQEQIQRADYVLVIASPGYRQRADEPGQAGVGRGVNFEVALLRERVYADRGTWFARILPVILPGQDSGGIPAFLNPTSGGYYTVSDFTLAGAETLIRALTGQPVVRERRTGGVPSLPPKSTKLTVVVVGASPFDIALERLRGDREYQAISRVTRAGALDLVAQTLGTDTDIRELLAKHPDILHICGRYRHSDRMLLLESPLGEPTVISIDWLFKRLGLEREHHVLSLRAIVFSVPDSDLFASDFAHLADTVIAWRGALDVECTRAFATLFYGALAREPLRVISGAVRLAARDVDAAATTCESFADRLIMFPH